LQDGFTVPPWLRFPRPPYNPGRPDFPGPVWNLGFLPWAFPGSRGLNAGSYPPLLLLVCPQPRLLTSISVTSVLSSRPPHWPRKPPSVLSPFAQPWCCLDWGDVFPSPQWALPHCRRSYGLMRPSHCLSCPSVYSLVPGVSAGCHSAPAANRMFPTLSPQIFPQMPGPQSRRSHRVRLPVSSSMSSAFPRPFLGRLPACPTNTISPWWSIEIGGHSVMFKPLSLLVSQIVPTAAILPQGSWDFYFRAERASLPPHAPDMLSVRIQAIDGKRTFTFLDSRPCRLLQRSKIIWPLPNNNDSNDGRKPRHRPTL